MPEDRDVERLWVLAKVAETFHVLPSEAARAMDADPERLDTICAGLLGYGSLKRAYDAAEGDPKRLKNFDDDRVALIRKNQFTNHQERVAHVRHHRKKNVVDFDCRFCIGEIRDGDSGRSTRGHPSTKG